MMLCRAPLRIGAADALSIEWRAGRSGIDLVEISAWHPEGRYADQIPADELWLWLRKWRDLVAHPDVGPRLYPSISKQALHSYRLTIDHTSQSLRWHTDPDLHRLEYQAQSAQSPVRITPDQESSYDTLWHYDNTASISGFSLTSRCPESLCAGGRRVCL